jgi:hypothetical protein
MPRGFCHCDSVAAAMTEMFSVQLGVAVAMMRKHTRTFASRDHSLNR